MAVSFAPAELTRADYSEMCGVSSAGVLKFISALEEKGLYYHSLMFIRNGTVAAEIFRNPYSSAHPHCMFSISKTITCIALGFAVSEGLISLYDTVTDYFPEYIPAEPDGNLAKLKIRNLASMTSGKAPSYLLRKTDRDWLAHFFDSEWEASPGEKFRYVNENMFVLSALLHRVTGMSVTRFLTPRLWEPLNIETPYWETDCYGTESGGWGIRLKPEDFAKVFLCIQNKGSFAGRQIIPENWIMAASLNQAVGKSDPGSCKKDGYGFGMWRKSRTVFCGEGMYGQMGIINEKNGLLLMVTCGEYRTDNIWQAYNKLIDEIVPPTAYQTKKHRRLFVKNVLLRKWISP